MLEDPLIPELPLDVWPTWARALFWLWVAAIGASIGSFLNVVIYRTPRGMSLVHPGSHCPHCGHAIRARDNLPVVGWILLRGRCRDCGEGISARYPLVEALLALLFLLVAGLTIGFAGMNLPLGNHEQWRFLTERQLAGIAAYHLFLLTFLIAAGGMRIDQQRMPNWLVVVATAVGLLAPLLWPWLHPLQSGFTNPGSLPKGALVSGLLGGVAGGMAGWLRFAPRRAKRSWHWSSIVDVRLYAIAGVFLGWQGGLGVAVAAAVVGLLLAGVGRIWSWATKLPDELSLVAATLFVISSWKWTADYSRSIGWGAIPLVLTAFAAMIVLGRLESIVRQGTTPP